MRPLAWEQKEAKQVDPQGSRINRCKTSCGLCQETTVDNHTSIGIILTLPQTHMFEHKSLLEMVEMLDKL